MTIQQALALLPEERNKKVVEALGGRLIRNFNGCLNAMREAKLTLENSTTLANDYKRNLRYVQCASALMIPPYPSLTPTAEEECIAFLVTIFEEPNPLTPYPEADES